MKKVSFVGSVMKRDIILYIAKILASMGEKVIIIDLKTTKDIFGTIVNPYEDSTLIKKDNLDVSKTNQIDITKYDYVLYDIDTTRHLKENTGQVVFVTDINKTNILNTQKLAQFLKPRKAENNIIIYKDYVDCRINTEYVKRVYFNNVSIKKTFIIEFDEKNYITNIEDQFNNSITFKKLSKDFKKVLIDLLIELTGKSQREYKKVIRQLKKED